MENNMRLNMDISNLTHEQVRMVRHLAYLAEGQLDNLVAYGMVDEPTMRGYEQRLEDVVDLWERCANINNDKALAEYFSDAN
jgi:hypothetical protein